ncbi:MAG: hypothetical protein KJ052_04470 [Candidatus Hydrogenedentes bacterium]|nr:hypothetical protein [Candidatus Hydrogenedentota bacterium]
MIMPYAVAPRPETGFYNAQLGTWLFLVAETMFFGALISSYALLRTTAVGWPEDGNAIPWLFSFGVTAAMVVLGAVSFTLNQEKLASLTRFLWLATGLGVACCILYGLQLRVLVQHGHTPASSTYYGLYHLFAGILILHFLLGGLACVYSLAMAGGSRDAAAALCRVRCIALYWRFLVLITLVIMALFYFS